MAIKREIFQGAKLEKHLADFVHAGGDWRHYFSLQCQRDFGGNAASLICNILNGY